MKRVLSIDIARALGIVLVVAGHYFPDGSPLWYSEVRDWIYTFHMPLFMFLSGYVYSLTMRDETYLNFLHRKARRLLIPYIIVSFVIIAIKLVGQKAMGMDLKNPVGIGTFAAAFIRPEAAIHLWFIFALWWIFAIVPLFRWKGGHVLLLAIAAAVHYLPQLLPEICYPEIFCLDKAACFMIYFMLGVVLCDSGFDLRKRHLFLSLSVLAVFISGSVFGFARFAAEYIGIAGILALSSLLQSLPEKCLRPVMAISDSSYTIYLVHSIFIGFVVTAMKAVPVLLDTGSRWFALGAFIVIAAAVLFSMLTHILIRKTHLSFNKTKKS